MNRNEMIDRATLGDTLRDFLKDFYGDLVQKVITQEPEAADDLDKSVEALWIHEEKDYPGTPSVALLAGSTLWFDYPNSRRVESDDALSEMKDPREGWVQVWPAPAKMESEMRHKQGEIIEFTAQRFCVLCRHEFRAGDVVSVTLREDWDEAEGQGQGGPWGYGGYTGGALRRIATEIRDLGTGEILSK